MLVAFGVGVILIGGSFYVSASGETVPGDVTAITPSAPERQYIKPSDSDGDGISDWAEELLRDRESLSRDLDPAQEYVLPSTLTGRFSIKFFQDYLTQKGLGSSGEDKDELAKKAIEILEREAKDRIYTLDDITLSLDDSPEARKAYGNRIAAITADYDVPSKLDEIEILNRALQSENPKRLEELDPIIQSYKNYFEETKKTPVPPGLARQHVDLLNVYNALLNDITAMRYMFEDPLLGTIRFKRYNDDVAGLVYVYYNIDRTLKRTGVSYSEDEPGAMFNQLSILREFVK